MGFIRRLLRGKPPDKRLRVREGRVARPRPPRDDGFASSQLRRESEYAGLSQLSYDAETGRGEGSKFERAFRDSGLSGIYRVDEELSDANRTTFQDTRTGRGVIAFRGTNLKNAGDLGTDAAVAFGLQRLTPRFGDAERVTRGAIERYGGAGNVDVTGHSLGGTQAMHATNRTGVHSYSFNPGAGLSRNQLSQMGLGGVGAAASLLNRGRLTSGNATVISTGVDPLSLMSRETAARQRFVMPRGFNVHGIDNFL